VAMSSSPLDSAGLMAYRTACCVSVDVNSPLNIINAPKDARGLRRLAVTASAGRGDLPLESEKKFEAAESSPCGFVKDLHVMQGPGVTG